MNLDNVILDYERQVLLPTREVILINVGDVFGYTRIWKNGDDVCEEHIDYIGREGNNIRINSRVYSSEYGYMQTTKTIRAMRFTFNFVAEHLEGFVKKSDKEIQHARL